MIRTLQVLALLTVPVSFASNSSSPTRQYSAREFYETTTMMGLAFSFDESSVFASSNASQIFNIYRIDLSTRRQEQITHSQSDSIFIISSFRHDDRILFTKIRVVTSLSISTFEKAMEKQST
jgi:hypothetical protein